jgi:hypothetical protein
MKVTNMDSRNGRKVANQFIIETANARIFQSYNSTIVVKKYSGETLLDERFYKYSKTTSRYRNEFLNESLKETEAKIKSGQYKLANLQGENY